MRVYQTNEEGVFIGYAQAELSPLDLAPTDPKVEAKEVWLIPGGCVTVDPPSFGEGQRARWDRAAEEWIIEPVPEPEPDPDAPPEAPQPSRLDMAVFWSRMTDDEAEAFDAALPSLRLRRIVGALVLIDKTHPDYATIRQLVVDVTNETRADAILAPTL